MWGFVILLRYVLVLCCIQNPQNQGDLKVVVHDIKAIKGNIVISIFSSSSGFPADNSKAIKIQTLRVTGHSIDFAFRNVPFGTYAVTVHHDENVNKVIDRNFLGIPNEGLGVSNNAKGFMGPPKYDDAKFKFSKSGQAANISLVYL